MEKRVKAFVECGFCGSQLVESQNLVIRWDVYEVPVTECRSCGIEFPKYPKWAKEQRSEGR